MSHQDDLTDHDDHTPDPLGRTVFRRPVPPSPESAHGSDEPRPTLATFRHQPDDLPARTFTDEVPRGVRFVAGYLLFSMWLFGAGGVALVGAAASIGFGEPSPGPGPLVAVIALFAGGIWLGVVLRRKLLDGRNWARIILTALFSCSLVGSLRTTAPQTAEVVANNGSFAGILFAAWCLFWLAFTVALLYHLWTSESSEHFADR